MKNKLSIIYLVCFITFTFSQEKSIDPEDVTTNKEIEYKPLSPAKAAFYSAIFPGAGQIYNNRYWWQLPLIYGGLGLSTYYYTTNTREYNRFRTAFKLRKSGFPDEFNGENGNPFISESGLENAQKKLQENRDFSVLSMLLVYALQIVEASVSAHLLQFDTSNNLSIRPTGINNTFTTTEELPGIGLSVKYTF